MLKKIFFLLVSISVISFFPQGSVFAQQEIPLNISAISKMDANNKWSLSGTTFPGAEITIDGLKTQADKNGFFKLEGFDIEKGDIKVKVSFEEQSSEIIVDVNNPSATVSSFNEKKDELDFELIDDIAVFTYKQDLIWSAELHIKNFGYDMAKLLKKNHKEIKNGAIFNSKVIFGDVYGNERLGNAITVYYKQETIDKINFNNWATSLYDLYYAADAYWAAPEFKIGPITSVRSGVEFAPDIYYNYIGY